jgi:hypothetical protein
MSQDKVDDLLDEVISKASVKFEGAYNWSKVTKTLAVQNVLLAELIETLRERLPPNVPT